jgi:quercetin dioxygenase-like cupin family protein
VPKGLQVVGANKAATILAALFTVASGSGIGAQPPAAAKQAPAAKHVMLLPGDLKWGPGPPGLPAGAQAAVIDGDPGKAGLFTIRAKLPDGYKIAPHSHPTDEHVTVLSGTLKAGSGAKWDDASMHPLTAGGYAKMVKGVNHYVAAQGETIIQITAMGPFMITYVNPKDDPRKITN